MKFFYKGRTEKGEIESGIIEASNEETALSLLEKHGFFITSLERAEKKPFWAREISIFNKVSAKDLVIFFRQLAILFSSGVSLSESLKTLIEQTENEKLREIIKEVTREVEAGVSLSESFSRKAEVFSTFYIKIIESGELSGTLTEALNYVADHIENDYYLNSKIKGAMYYPIFILTVFIIIFLVMIFWIFPPLSELIKESGKDLPATTKFLISIPNFFKKSAGWIFISISGIFLFFFQYIKTREGQQLFDEFKIKIPLIGNFLRNFYLTQFADNLSTLISAGLPIAKSLEISANVVGNNVYKEIILEVQKGVNSGKPISQTLKLFPEDIPPVFVQAVMVGEQTGRLAVILKTISRFYRNQTETNLNSLLSLIEPLLIIVIGIGVGIFVASFLIPLYSIFSDMGS